MACLLEPNHGFNQLTASALLLVAHVSQVHLPFVLLLVFGAAKLLAYICECLGQPGLVGEIIGRIVLGPSALNWVRPDEVLTSLAEMGAIFLLFRVGLEVRASDLMRVGGHGFYYSRPGRDSSICARLARHENEWSICNTSRFRRSCHCSHKHRNYGARLRGGSFNQSAMLSLLPVLLNDGRTRGFPITRFIADMAWVLNDPAALDHLLEFECRANLALPRAGDIVICAYDLDKFSASIVIDALRTHPIVLIGGIVQRNPFYVPREELLKELSEREPPEAGRTASA